MRHLTLPSAALVAVIAAAPHTTLATPPQYTIINIGLVDPGDFASQGFGVSPNGIATGRSFGSPTLAFSWTELGGLVALPNLAGRSFSVGNDANDAGLIVGTGSTTAWGADPLPLVWQDGAVAQLPLPAGESMGRATAVNATGVAVGSVGAGSFEYGVIYDGDTATVITTTTPEGCFLRTAYGINDAGLIAGFGIDPNNAARNVGFVYDMISGDAYEVEPLPGDNGAIAFGLGDAGHVVGSSMMNQGDGTPFVWTSAGGSVEIPLPPATSLGSARAVNSSGWVVGNAGGVYAVPFLYDGTETYALADLIDPGTGWGLDDNTSSSALGISDNGIIVGTGEYNGEVRAYAMIPVSEPCVGDLNGDGQRDQADLGELLAHYNVDDGGDLDGDGDTDQADLGALLARYGEDC
jgi:uncharacterized membrane protein